MRPETAHRIVRRALEVYNKTKDTTKLYAALPAVDKLIDKQIQWYLNYEGDIEYDTRNPYDVYGYETREKIDGDLAYIADRFNADFRLNYLRVGILDKQF